MKKIVKRVSAAVIALAVVLTAVMLDVPGMTASAASSGTCGTGLTWTLDDNGTLTISGSRRMTGYGSTTSSKSPWKTIGMSAPSAVRVAQIPHCVRISQRCYR